MTKTEKDRLTFLAERFRQTSHFWFDADPFFSCTANPDYFYTQKLPGKCTCGMAENNKLVDEMVKLINLIEVVG